jgi:hypothetical protein
MRARARLCCNPDKQNKTRHVNKPAKQTRHNAEIASPLSTSNLAIGVEEDWGEGCGKGGGFCTSWSWKELQVVDKYGVLVRLY